MPEEQPDSVPQRPKRKKKAPAHFKPGGAALVQNLLAGANDIADRSFLGGGGPTLQPATAPSPRRAGEQTGVHVSAPDIGPPQNGGSSPHEREDGASTAPPVLSQTYPADGVMVPPTSDAAGPGEEPSPSPVRGWQGEVSTSHSPEGEAVPQRPPSSSEAGHTPGTHTSAETMRSPRLRGPWAHKAIQDSFADAKLRSARWKSHGFRISPEVLKRLKNRLNADRRATGNSGLALGHYVDAALRNLPEAVEEQIELAAAFEAAQLWDQERTQPSNYRVGEEAYLLMSNLKLALQEAAFGRRGTHVVSAGLERLLDALESEGPLQRPEHRRH